MTTMTTTQTLLISLAARINDATGLHLSREANQTGNFVLRPADIITLAGIVEMAQTVSRTVAGKVAKRDYWCAVARAYGAKRRAGKVKQSRTAQALASVGARHANTPPQGKPPVCILTPRGYTRDPNYSGPRGKAGA